MEQDQGMKSAELAAVCVPVTDVTFSSEAGEDVSLPDYYPEVRHVISVFSRALPESRFLSGKTLELDGTVCSSVLYLGEDGGLCCVPISTEYTAQTAVPESVTAAGLFTDTRLENTSCRVTGPRKLSLKYRLRHRVLALEEVPSSPRAVDEEGGHLSGRDLLSVERHETTISGVRMAGGRLTANVSGVLHEKAGMKPVMCDGVIRISEARAADGGVNVRGEAILRALFYADDGAYVVAQAKAPIEETVPVSGAAEGDRARCEGRCASSSLSPDEGGSGEYAWEMEFDLDAEVQRSCPAVVTDDAYSTAAETVLTYAEREVLSPSRCAVGSLSVSGSGRGKAPDGEESGRLLGLWAEAEPENVTAGDGRLVLTGTCRVKALCAGGGDAWCEEFGIPFHYECDGGVSDDVIWRGDVAVTDISGRMDGEKITVNAELGISLAVMGRDKRRYVSEIKADRTSVPGEADGMWKLCYPERGDRLWDIAMRYHADVAELKAQNGIASPDDPVGKAILIK